MSIKEGITDSIEAKYHKLMAEVKNRKAEAEIEKEKADFEQAWEDFKAEGGAKSQEMQEKVVNSWNALEQKVKSLF